ncbi:MAG: helicase C-terminal domain-containing protein [Sedimentisphaerales bacterium]|nr:helicase C-terminal domain-containing protein [Sedimentisphaerales bacterium]
MIRPNTYLDIREAFAPAGCISQSLAEFEVRPEQVEMAGAIQRAILDCRHLAVEAGTGVGKSFAYLIPAIEYVCRTGEKAVISTYTITLQEQLINKDIPFLADCIDQKFAAALAKGRGNYLCKRRLEFALRRQRSLFDDFGSELEEISNWAGATEDGSLSDMPFLPKSHVWDKVRSEHGNCRGRKCPHFRNCFYWRARRRLDKADIIIANHALFFSDLVLREEGASILPDYKFVVIDEAHNIEHVAEDHFGINISNHRIRYMLDGLYNPRTHRGLLAHMNADKAIDLVGRAGRKSTNFLKDVRNWYEGVKDQTNGRCYKHFIEDTISGYFKDLSSELSKLAKHIEDVDEKFEVMRFNDRCKGLVHDFENFLMQKQPDYVYWVEVSSGRSRTTRLRSAAVNVGPDVKRCLFDEYESVILTSATLSTAQAGEKSGFDFFVSRIGLEDFDAVKLGSPFDYEQQVTMYIEKDLPNPNERAFTGAAAEVLKKYILKTSGRAFVLFTSYAMLEEIAGKLSDWLAENDIALLQQGADVDRTTLLKCFKAQGSSVLFGTDSFWQGVDVPGEMLSNVIIARLPFAVPDQPLLAGRLEQIREQGGNPFFDYQLPSAIIKFKQGFGRLIRSKSDSGIVVILDSRIVSKPYGKKFLSAIPKCKTKIIDAGG